MMPEQETVEIVGVSGHRYVVDVVARFGDGIVHRNLTSPENFVITHAPTGAVIPCFFHSAVQAEMALEAIDKIINWTGFVTALSMGKRPNCLDQIKDILIEHGGRPIDNTNAKQSRPEILHRLEASKHLSNDEGKWDMTKLSKGHGLSKKTLSALTEHGISTIDELCAYPFDHLGDLAGIGPKALLSIAKVQNTLLRNAPLTVDIKPEDIPDPVPGDIKPVEEKKYMTKEPPEELRTVTTKTYTVKLQFRHAQWVERAAEAYGMTEDQVIEQSIRQAYARDPYKAGETAVSGSILKHDNPYTKK